MTVYELWPRFAALFDGLDTAFGTGAGRWIKRPPRPEDWVQHLNGQGPGIGIAPLRPDNTVTFAAIDLDEPDFEAAQEMQQYLPGVSWLEKSRSGNAHVWVFFNEPIEAWVPMGIMKEATLAAGKPHVEVFPKNYDFSRVKLGNYINLPLHGNSRPIVGYREQGFGGRNYPEGLSAESFIELADANRAKSDDWRKRADWLQIHAPENRERNAEFGTQTNLHICAEHIIEHAEDNPVLEGHRAAVYFALAKMLTNWEGCDHDEAVMMMRSVNSASPDRISDAELLRILGNAERGRFTSTGCDDPLVVPYTHPECKIAHPRS